MIESLENQSIAVLMGGPGAERDVSLRSGAAVANALRTIGAHVEEVDVRDGSFDLPEGIVLAVNMIHGTFGEDGQIQAILDARGVAGTSERGAGSRHALYKMARKERFAATGVPTPKWEIVSPGARPAMQPPLVAKPPREGSSVCVHIVRDAGSLEAALDDCF